MIYLTIAFAHALHHHLRGGDPKDELMRLLEEPVLTAVLASRNRPAAIIRELGANLHVALRDKWIEPALAVTLDGTLTALDRVLAGCERIKSTPIPFSYTLLLHRTANLYYFLLPFGLIDSLGRLTPLVLGLVSYTFFGLDALGDEIEEPFGLAANDLPLAAMSRGIEIDLREAAGEKDLPTPLLPQDYCLM
jgi:putative membrane protein